MELGFIISFSIGAIAAQIFLNCTETGRRSMEWLSNKLWKSKEG